MKQAENPSYHSFGVGMVAQTVLWAMLLPSALTAITRSFEADVFMGQVLFLSPSQQHQSSEG